MADHADRAHVPGAAKEAEAARRVEPGEGHQALEARPEVEAELGHRAMLNGRPAMVAQRKAAASLAGRAAGPQPVQPPAAPNRTGLPDRLKAGAEALSGVSLDGVKVHYNSPKPAQLNAHAYAQGSDIHVAPGQERHLPHEAWHVVQQAQGRVRPTMQLKEGVPVNDDSGLEREADLLGLKALQVAGAGSPEKARPDRESPRPAQRQTGGIQAPPGAGDVVQRNGEELSRIASDIASGAQDIRDEALGLSDKQIEIIEAMLLQMQLLETMESQLREIERLQEAALPPIIPLDSFIEFQPSFAALAPQVEDRSLLGEIDRRASTYKGAMASPPAAAELVRRLGTGLKPANQLKGVALSGDEHVAGVVSVNVIPPTRGKKHEGSAEFATTNPAGGALPIAIEQFGDDESLDISLLTRRAWDSAVLVIDPAKLSEDEIAMVQRSSEGGGETGLAAVPPASIVAVIAPANLAPYLDSSLIARFNIHFVGATKQNVYYAGTKKIVRLLAPDYRPALAQILKLNPKKTLMTHTTRLGVPKPVKGGKDDSGSDGSDSSDSDSGSDSTRDALIERGVRQFEALRAKWRAQHESRAGKSPPGYDDRVAAVRSIALAPSHITLAELRQELSGWLRTQASVSGM